ncbi:MAG: phenylalanine--tRNA ligase subunit beta [Desulfovibrio sp.]|jgi:phenylalanyl-tRNA synthetase beta chain|nr:phenylalanine--tRNA ligase subunit beta [Desulfovibrio sp.]
MLLSLKWLREFVPFEGTAEELGAKLTMSGLEMEGLERPFAGLKSLVVGLVATCARHPESDHLSVCRVDVGGEILNIVCGAPNVAAGQKVAVVRAGGVLPDGTPIRAARLRGAPSQGMICSEAELGLSAEHEGILVLDPSSRVGASLPDALDLDDEVLNIAVTPNRGDCLSVLGLAREVSALYGLPLTPPETRLTEEGDPAAMALALEVADGNLCPLYQGRIIENAVNGGSPARLRYRLRAVGLRAVSCLVDVTNYILMELGQPLHAFDLDRLEGGRVSVRGADPGEILVTLDGQERSLLPSDITIRDSFRALGLGGVMGGRNSEITGESRRVFLECAIFQPSAIRRTARRLAMNSDAAYRFERGVDQTGAGYALDRAAAMIAELSGGRVRPGVLRVEHRPWKAPCITLRKRKAEVLLGIPLEDAFCAETLARLGCGVETPAPANSGGEPVGIWKDVFPFDGPEVVEEGSVWKVFPPGYRPDLVREADLTEELARVYGVDRIEPAVPAIVRSLPRAGLPESGYRFRSRVKHWAKGLGLNETINYSFTSHKELDVFDPAGGGRIGILNPLSDEHNVLRTLLAPGLLAALRANLAQGAAGLRLFEVAAVFSADPSSPTTAREEQRLGLLLHGSRFDSGWPQVQQDADFQDLAGILEHLLRAFSLPPADLRPADPSVYPWLSPAVDIFVQNSPLGFLGRVRPGTAAAYHARKPVWLAECNLDSLQALHRAVRPAFRPLPVFPPIRRDVTLICPPGFSGSRILEAIRDLGGFLLAEVRLIDCFEPQDRGDRHLTYRLTFRHPSRTLKDAEADQQRDAIVAALTGALPVRL